MTDVAVRLRGKGAAVWALVAAVLSVVAICGVFLVAPEDADQGIIQKIFYFHVPIANASLVAFGVACVAGILALRTRHPRWDEVLTASIGIGLLFAGLTIVSGSIWARASWGHWWRWDDARLTTYLIIVLIYAGFFVLRSSVEADRRARFSAIYAVIAFASVPLSFYAVRIATSFIHPVVFNSQGANLPNSMLVWFVVSQAAIIAVYIAFLLLELAQRRTESSLRRLRLALEA
jgi:heme exporter protein C